jgi:hypothetical protein
MPKILTPEEKAKKANDKYFKSKKGKEAMRKANQKRSGLQFQITPISESTKQAFNNLKELKGYTADQLLRELLGMA